MVRNKGGRRGLPAIVVVNASTSRLPSRFRPVLDLAAGRLLSTGAAPAEITVRLVGDAEMSGLNRRWKGRGRTTDVLAFATGDVAVSADRARVQARELGHSFRTELLLLAIHGLQHLAGRRDDSAAARAAMLAEGERILAAVTAETRKERPRRR